MKLINQAFSKTQAINNICSSFYCGNIKSGYEQIVRFEHNLIIIIPENKVKKSYTCYDEKKNR
mgnify:CR=1 FL=1